MMKPAATFALLAIAVGAGWLLFSGSELLDAELPFRFPAGNLAAAVMLVATAAIALLLGTRGPKLRALARITFLLAVAWLPVSMAIAGGMQLSFSGWRSWAWIAYTLFVLLAIPAVLAWAAVAALLARRKAA